MWHSLTSLIPRRALWPSVVLLLLLGAPVALGAAVLGLLLGLLRLLGALAASVLQLLAFGLLAWVLVRLALLLLGSTFTLPPWSAWLF